MHAAYVIGTSARNSRYILENKLKKLVPLALLSYIRAWEFLRTLEKCGEAWAEGECFSHFSSVLKNSQVFV